METPALVLIPSSPLTHTPSPALSSSKDSSPISSDSSHTSPPSSYGILVEEQTRNSSESTIFSIYSMYSERRQTWRKSALANGTYPPFVKGREEGPRECAEAVTDEGRGSDSFYRAPVSRQSSSGSGFFAGSANGSGRHQSQSRSASRHTATPTLLDTSSRAGKEFTELPYADRDSLPNYSTHLSASTSASVVATDMHAPINRRTQSPQSVPSWGKFVNLTLSDDSSLLHYSPAFGKAHDSSRATTVESEETWDKPAKPARASPHTASVHSKNDSTSTSGHLGLALSNVSIHGMDSMSTTHEGYVTAPQSVESASAGSHVTPAMRFRVANPSPSPSSSSPPFRSSITRPSSSSFSQRSSPTRPTTSPAVPSPISQAKRESIILSVPPRPTTAIPTPGSSLHGSVTPAVGEEPEAYFVRNTYAQLEFTGVKGDGYEEGIERTRAKLGHDRQSVQLAVRGDAKEDNKGDIAQKELDILSNVDRYGFFVVPSHDRLVLLPSASLSKPLHHTTQTNASYPPSPEPLTSMPDPPTVSKARETGRIAKWERMLEAERRDAGGNVSVWRVAASKERKLRERVFKGIPDRWRAAAWEVLVGRWVSSSQKQAHKQELNARALEGALENLRREYRSSLDRPSSYDVQIDLDVPRTVNGHVLFKTRYGQGQRALFHTLHSFSLVCEECGYCQGMGPLASTLLCYYEPEKVYATLVHFHDEYQMHDIFLPGFPGLLEAIYIQERIIQKMLPTVYASFKKHMISTTSYATKWYITLFANSVPFQTQLRLWDVFLLEGRDVFVITAVAIVWVLKDHLTASQASFETMLSLLSSFFVPEDEDALLKWIERALDDKKLRADMVQWRQQWQRLVADKKDGSALL
ncbi:hypothetical protein EW145_g7345 [Phellinidium pouzarii]|uniref:Rab-GAP TBC domain-containing protein n=1 Tax=Phellinidium pouzarii TaxID=167371 RepID=A0A4S4KKJ4_9AGAM|nr:hypothetical protein EW145_g7345 [Phellinidium pouzarii]